MSFKSPSANSLDLILLIAIVVFGVLARAFLIHHLGIKLFGDYAGYSAYAESLAGKTHDPSGWMDITTFRLPGYPILIYLARIISVDYADLILVSINIVGVTIACCCMYFAVRSLGFSRLLAAIGYLFVNYSELLVWELTPLPSALAAAFYFGTGSYTLIVLRRGVRPSSSALVTIGFLTAGTMFLSEGALLVAIVNFAVLMMFKAFKPHEKLRAVGMALGPAMICLTCLVSWNLARTGEAFLTTGWITAGLHPIVVAASRGLFVLNPDNPTDALIAARIDQEATNMFRQTLTVLDEMYAKNPMPSVEFSRLLRRYYFDAVLRQPYAMTANALWNMKEGVESSLAPAFSRVFWYNWPPDSKVFPRIARIDQLFKQSQVFDAMIVTLNMLSFFFAPFFALIRRIYGGGDRGSIDVILASSIFCIVPFLVFSPIHMEVRYVVSTIPFVFFNSLVLCRFAWFGSSKIDQPQ